jgi:rod shape-determining protein MreC
VLSLVMITVYFRESASGPLHDVQAVGATALRPFEVVAERVARPFRDAAAWVDGYLDAKAENDDLKRENAELRRQVIQNESALQENVHLSSALDYVKSDRFPTGFGAVTTQVIAHPPSRWEQHVTIAAGSNDGIRDDDAVVTPEGLVGRVTLVTPSASRVTLLTDETSAVAADDLVSGATGVIRHGQGETLVLDRVSKEENVDDGDPIITAGRLEGDDRLRSIYPRGIPIGRIVSHGQRDTDLFQQVQVEPFVDFSSLDSVIVLVPKSRGAKVVR